MPAEMNEVFAFKPSLRRAYFFSLLYAGLVLYGRYETNLDRSLNKVWLVMLGILLLSLLYALLRRATTDYVVNETGVSKTSGIIARDTRGLPMDRITNAACRQTVLDRVLGLSSVFFDTAGGPGPEVVFLRITSREADRVVGFLKKVAFQKTTAEPGKARAAVTANL